MEKSIFERVSELNQQNHESSTLIECKPNINANGGVWVKKNEISRLDKVGQPVYMDEENVLLYPMSHIMVVGSTGVGKTTVIYDNQIDFYSSLPENIRPNMFISDVKGDSYGKLAKGLRDKGYLVYRFDGSEPYFSTRYNPLTKIYRDYHKAKSLKKMIDEDKIGKKYNGVKYDTKDEAIGIANVDYLKIRESAERGIAELAEIMIVNTDMKNLSWTMGGRACLRAIINGMLRDSEKPYLGLTEEKFTIANLCRIACDASENYERIVEWLEKYEDDDLVIENALSSVYRLKATITRDGYLSSMTAELAKFTPLSIEALTSNSDFDIEELVNGDKSFAIFFVPNDRVSIIDNIGMLFLNNILNTLCEKADKNPQRCLERDFVALIDEFANFPKIPEMVKKISTYRSRKIWLELSIQSIEQLYTKYGKEETEAIIDNCNNTFFLGCNNYETRRKYSEQFGLKLGNEYSVSMGNEENPNISTRAINVPLIKMSDLERIELGTFYLRSSVGDNLKSSIIPYFRRNDVSQIYYEDKKLYNGHKEGANIYTLKDAERGELAEEDRKREEELKKKPKVEAKEPPKRTEQPKGLFSFLEYNEKTKRSKPNYVVDQNDRKKLLYSLWTEISERSKTIDKGEKLLDEIGKQKIFTEDINFMFKNKKCERPHNYPLFGKVSREIWLLDLENVLEFNMEFGQERGRNAYLRRLKRSLRLVKSNKLFDKEIVEIFERLINKYKTLSKKGFAQRYDFIKGILIFP